MLTRGLTPTPATPGWKLPLAVGTFWPILRRGFLIVDRADLRRLQHGCSGIVQDRLERRSRQTGNREIGARYVAELIQRDVRACWRSSRAGGSRSRVVGVVVVAEVPVVVVVLEVEDVDV